MTARVEAERAITDVLAEHQPVYWMHGDGSPVGCTCMDRVFVRGQESWPSHVASVLADLMAERQAEAWEQGRKYGIAEEAQMTVPRLGNPFRPDPKDTRDE